MKFFDELYFNLKLHLKLNIKSMNVIEFFSMPCHIQSYYDLQHENEHDCHEMSIRCPVKHICMLINQTINEIYM